MSAQVSLPAPSTSLPQSQEKRSTSCIPRPEVAPGGDGSLQATVVLPSETPIPSHLHKHHPRPRGVKETGVTRGDARGRERISRTWERARSGTHIERTRTPT